MKPLQPTLDGPSLDSFSLDAFESAVDQMSCAGFQFAPISALPATIDSPDKLVYLRHDIDLFMDAALPIARIEARRGARATYYLLLTGPYSPTHPDSRAVLQELVALGHEVGLHYDVTTYPPGDVAAQRLEEEISIVEGLTGRPVTTISTHQPSLSGTDPFRESTARVHPHAPVWSGRFGYISDSCRAWRRDWLDEMCRGPQTKWMWLTHPESWLDGRITDRHAYLDAVVRPRIVRSTTLYASRELPSVWSGHAGAEQHDARQAELGGPQWAWLDRESTGEHACEIAEFANACAPELNWNASHVLAERPGKWDVSLVARQRGKIVALSVNSVAQIDGRDWLYVHVLAVGSDQRGSGLGRACVGRLHARAAQRNLAGLYLKVAWANEAAVRFYGRCGFRIHATEPALSQLALRLPLDGDAESARP